MEKKTVGLCRLGKRQIDHYRRERHPSHAELGIIRDPACWRLCRYRHKRHTFAVRALEASPAGRRRVGQHMVALATYVGHVNISATYWYLETTPDLLREIATAGETFFNGGQL